MGDKERMRKEAFERFDMLLKDEGEYTKTLDLGKNHKYAVFSDMHIGDGKDSTDNFRQNEDIFVKALEYYRDAENNYSIILLGDIEEFHQFELIRIIARYNDSVYDALRKFPKERVHRVFGNHDIDWALEDPLSIKQKKIAAEAIKLKKDGYVIMMLTHGHQAEETYEQDLHTVRFGTTFYKIVERLGKVRSQSLLRQKPGHKDEIYDDWAEENKKILVCGHTHCPIFASHYIDYDWMINKHDEIKNEIEKIKDKGDREEIKRLRKRKEWLYRESKDISNRIKSTGFSPPKSPKRSLSRYYYNSGACLFRDGISNIEIEEDMIRLVYWFNGDDQREMLWQSRISSIIF